MGKIEGWSESFSAEGVGWTVNWVNSPNESPVGMFEDSIKPAKLLKGPYRVFKQASRILQIFLCGDKNLANDCAQNKAWFLLSALRSRNELMNNFIFGSTPPHRCTEKQVKHNDKVVHHIQTRRTREPSIPGIPTPESTNLFDPTKYY